MKGTAVVKTVKPADVLNCLIPLIGSGPGATPAADDFTAGVLLAFYAAGLNLDAKRLTAHATRYSRWPSWKMLEHAGHDCAFIQLNHLHHAMCVLDTENVFEHVKVVRIGSSSGVCTLKGFLETLLRLT